MAQSSALQSRSCTAELVQLQLALAAFWRGDIAAAEFEASEVMASAERVILPDAHVISLKANAANILAGVHNLRGDAATALRMLDFAEANDPCGVREARATLLLALGRWREGWPLMARNAAWAIPQPGVHMLMWTGQPPPATIFVYQTPNSAGFGDVMAYIRFLPLLRERGYGVVFHCMAQLVSLATRSLRGSGVTVEAVGKTASNVHYALPLFGLAAAFAIEPHSIPPPLRLKPDPALVAKYRSKLPRNAIGLCWASGPGQHALVKPMKGVALAAMEPIWSRFPCVALQVGPDRSQLDGTPVLDVLPANPLTFEPTAALAACCRAVVSIDTSIVHLAGGLGVPTHVPLHRGSANAFFLADVEGAPWQHVCPWYPDTMRVYRRPADGDAREAVAPLPRRWHRDVPNWGIPGAATVWASC